MESRSGTLSAAHRSAILVKGDPQRRSLAQLPSDILSSQERQVSEIAVQKGDLDFVMVDKRLGKVLLFESGKPVFSGAALTGESTLDRLPPGSLSMYSTKMVGLKYKVTPAGRFTLTRDYDSAYASLFNIKELEGKDSNT